MIFFQKSFTILYPRLAEIINGKSKNLKQSEVGVDNSQFSESETLSEVDSQAASATSNSKQKQRSYFSEKILQNTNQKGLLLDRNQKELSIRQNVGGKKTTNDGSRDNLKLPTEYLTKFAQKYPLLAQFSQEKSWQCGDAYISWRSRCYTNPATGEKLGYKYVVNPKTKRKNKVRIGMNYQQYQKARAQAWKKKQTGKELTETDKIFITSVAKKQQKIAKKKESRKFKKAAKSVGITKISDNGIAEVDPFAIAVDPKRFQYKIKAKSESGSVESLKGVTKWDRNLGGVIQVYFDKKQNKTFVVNGHNRLDLAKRLNAASITIRFLQVETAKEARAVGALTNIAEGRGNAQDAAKFFRDSGLSKADLDAKGIPMRERVAQNGLALANLSSELFDRVVQGTLPEQRAVLIGSKLKDKSQQEALVKLIAKEEKRGRRITNDVLSELADMTSTAPKKIEGQSDQLSLLDALGFEPEEQILAIEKAQVTASIKRKLVRDQKLFSTVAKSKAAKDLEKGGNIINVEESKAIAKDANTTLQLFDKVKRYRGGVDNALNEAAEKIANGENKEKVLNETYAKISENLKETYKYGETKGVGRSKTGDRRKNSQISQLSTYQKNIVEFDAKMREFENLYPNLAEFAKEKGWRCGKSFISWRSRCYTNPKTGEKLGYKYEINPKTGRRRKVRIGLTYKEYVRSRTKAVKKKGQGKKLTKLEEKLVADTKDLAARTRKKKQRSLDTKNKRNSKKEAAKAKDSLLSGGALVYKNANGRTIKAQYVRDEDVSYIKIDDLSKRRNLSKRVASESDLENYVNGLYDPKQQAVTGDEIPKIVGKKGTSDSSKSKSETQYKPSNLKYKDLNKPTQNLYDGAKRKIEDFNDDRVLATIEAIAEVQGKELKKGIPQSYVVEAIQYETAGGVKKSTSNNPERIKQLTQILDREKSSDIPKEKAYGILDKTIKDWDSNTKLKVFVPSLLKRSQRQEIEDVGDEVVNTLKKSGIKDIITVRGKRKANPEFLAATDAIADEVIKNQKKFKNKRTKFMKGENIIEFSKLQEYAVYFKGRNTPVLVSANNRATAIVKARKTNAAGSKGKVLKARLLTDRERVQAAKGGWIRTRVDGSNPTDPKTKKQASRFKSKFRTGIVSQSKA